MFNLKLRVAIITMTALLNYSVIKFVDALGIVIDLETGSTKYSYVAIGLLSWVAILILDFYVYYNIIKSKK